MFLLKDCSIEWPWLTLRIFDFFFSGNWGVDLQAGSQFGYHLLFVILVAGILAAFLQVLILIFLLLQIWY